MFSFQVDKQVKAQVGLPDDIDGVVVSAKVCISNYGGKSKDATVIILGIVPKGGGVEKPYEQIISIGDPAFVRPSSTGHDVAAEGFFAKEMDGKPDGVSKSSNAAIFFQELHNNGFPMAQLDAQGVGALIGHGFHWKYRKETRTFKDKTNPAAKDRVETTDVLTVSRYYGPMQADPLSPAGNGHAQGFYQPPQQTFAAPSPFPALALPQAFAPAPGAFTGGFSTQQPAFQAAIPPPPTPFPPQPPQAFQPPPAQAPNGNPAVAKIASKIVSSLQTRGGRASRADIISDCWNAMAGDPDQQQVLSMMTDSFLQSLAPSGIKFDGQSLSL